MDHGVKSTIAGVMPSLFQADELAPYDFEANCQRRDRYGPEERLLFAILEDAISCYQIYLLARKEEEPPWCDSEAPTGVEVERPVFPGPPRSPRV